MAQCKQCGREMEFCCDACRTNWHHKRYHLGEWFCINDKFYMLASAAPGHLVLVDLDGKRWKDAIKVVEAVGLGITRAMMNAMTDTMPWREATIVEALRAREDLLNELDDLDDWMYRED